jgi:hypothetical protein
MKISDAQKLQLDVIRSVRFNAFDGEKIARDLEANPEAWVSAIMIPDLVALRDLPENVFNVCTLFVYTKTPRAFLHVFQDWNCDEAESLGTGGLGTSPLLPGSILRFWWD